ncbi:hypothetical protein CFOL_v3_08730, partial [Cephalotus follicularis]
VISFPLFCNALLSNHLPLISQANNSNNRKNGFVVEKFPSNLSHQPWIHTSFSSRHRGLSIVPLDSKTTGPAEEDNRALETVLKLYSAIKKQNIRELSDIIGDECRCVCNFNSFFQPFHGKTQVLGFFTALITSLGNNIEFVVKPTLHDGMTVGVQWKLEWSKTHMPLGKGFSLIICHDYRGKVFIRNVEMFMEPILHIEPLRLKIMAYALTMIDKMSPNSVFKSRMKKAICIVLTLFVMAAILSFLKHRLC